VGSRDWRPVPGMFVRGPTWTRLVIGRETVGVVARTTSHEIDRFKAYATHPGRR
jgi:hypothetical protein